MIEGYNAEVRSVCSLISTAIIIMVTTYKMEDVDDLQCLCVITEWL